MRNWEPIEKSMCLCSRHWDEEKSRGSLHAHAKTKRCSSRGRHESSVGFWSSETAPTDKTGSKQRTTHCHYCNRTMDDYDIRNGKVHIGFFEQFDAKDFQRVLLKLTRPYQERRPRKYQRLDGVSAILAKLPPPVPVYNLDFGGNDNIGDAGMAYIHLLPETVEVFDLSDCGLSSKGIKLLCEFLETNTSIAHLSLLCNDFGDEGAEHVADMLCTNRSIRELHISFCLVGPRGLGSIFDALTTNDVLRKLSCLDNVDENISDEHVANICRGLAVNRSVESVSLMAFAGIERTGMTNDAILHLETCLRSNVYLRDFKPFMPFGTKDSSGFSSPDEKVRYWLTLNRLNRKVIKDNYASLSDWLEAVVRSSEYERVDFSYFFLRNKPELCLLPQT